MATHRCHKNVHSEIRKKKFESSGFLNTKTINSYYIVIRYQSSPCRSQAELLTILWMRRRFEKNGGAKDFDFRQKNQFEKKGRGSSRVQGSGLQLGMMPYFLALREIPFCVRYLRSMFVSGN